MSSGTPLGLHNFGRSYQDERQQEVEVTADIGVSIFPMGTATWNTRNVRQRCRRRKFDAEYTVILRWRMVIR